MVEDTPIHNNKLGSAYLSACGISMVPWVAQGGESSCTTRGIPPGTHRKVTCLDRHLSCRTLGNASIALGDISWGTEIGGVCTQLQEWLMPAMEYGIAPEHEKVRAKADGLML